MSNARPPPKKARFEPTIKTDESSESLLNPSGDNAEGKKFLKVD